MTDRHPVKDDDDKPEKHEKHEKPRISDAEKMTVVLLEQPDGTTTSAEVPYPPMTQQINVEGVSYVHVGEDGDSWIYRRL